MQKKFYAGIDVGGMSIKSGIIDQDGNVLFKSSTSTKTGAMNALTQEFNRIKEQDQKFGYGIKSVGIGIPCLFDNQKGIISYGNNLGFDNFNVRQFAKQNYGYDIVLDNDATCAVYGEYVFGKGKGYKNVVLITVGTGIGCGIVLDGKKIPSYSSAVGELSHTVVKIGGRKCNCGRYGCYEAYASTSALIKDTKIAMRKNKDSLMWQTYNLSTVNGKTVFEYYHKDIVAKKVLDNFVKMVGVGVVNIANLMRPDIILIGGAISAQNELFIKPLKEILNREIFAIEHERAMPLEQAVLQNDAGIIGAASLTIE